MKTFKVHRTQDVSGISGVGEIAEGVQFHDGQIVVSWFGRFHEINVSPDIETWLAIHGHNGLTTIQYDGD